MEQITQDEKQKFIYSNTKKIGIHISDARSFYLIIYE